MAVRRLYEFLKGTLSSMFQIELGSGPVLKNSSGDLSVRNSADNDYVNVSAADPSSDEHLVTKGWADSAYAAAGTGYANGLREIAIPLGFADAGTPVDSTAQLPIGAVVSSVDWHPTTGFDGSADVIVGIAADTDMFAEASEFDLASTQAQSSNIRSAALGSAAAVKATLSGSPTQGAGTLYITYSVPAT